MDDLGGPLVFVAVAVVVVIVALSIARRRIDAMKRFAQSAGLTDVRTDAWLNVIGSWKGYIVKFQVIGAARNGPEHVSVEIAAVAPVRMIARKRHSFDFDILPFGPPVVQTAFDAEYVVRSDDFMLAERLLGDAKIGAEVRATIVERQDELKLDANCVRVLRVTGSISRDEAARSAWELAAVVVEQLGLPGVASG